MLQSLLREENSRLEKEHRALLAGTVIRGDSTVSLQSSEEKALRQQRARLEARMAILEDHNRQLEAQVLTSAKHATSSKHLVEQSISLVKTGSKIQATSIYSGHQSGRGLKVKSATSVCFQLFLIAKPICTE